MPPDPFDAWLARFAAASRVGRDADLNDELRDHLETRLTELTAAGVPRADAVRVCLNELGDAAGLASAFLPLSRRRRRKFLMRVSLASAATLAAGVGLVSLLAPPNPVLPPPAAAVAQDGPPPENAPPDGDGEAGTADGRADAKARRLSEALGEPSTAKNVRPGDSLRDALNVLANVHQITILPDRPALAAAGVKLGEVYLENPPILDGHPLRVVLDAVLNAGDGPELLAEPRDGVLYVTTALPADRPADPAAALEARLAGPPPDGFDFAASDLAELLLRLSRFADLPILPDREALPDGWETLNRFQIDPRPTEGAALPPNLGPNFTLARQLEVALGQLAPGAGLRAENRDGILYITADGPVVAPPRGEDSPQSERLTGQLEQPTTTEGLRPGDTLRHALDTFAGIHQITILPDRRALEELALEEVILENPPSLEGYSLRVALDALLNGVVMADGTDLAAVPRDGILYITTAEAAGADLETTIYNVRDLLTDAPPPVAFGGGGFGGGGPMGGGGMGGGGMGTAPRSAADELVAMILSVTGGADHGGSWHADDGVGGTVEHFDGLLAVRQTAAVHRQIEELLAALRRSDGERGWLEKAAAPADGPADEPGGGPVGAAAGPPDLTAEGVRVVILARAPDSRRAAQGVPDFSMYLGVPVAERLSRGGVRVVRVRAADRARPWAGGRPDRDAVTELAEEFSATHVLAFDLDRFDLREANSADLLRGRAGGLVTVYAADGAGGPARAVFRSDLNLRYPADAPRSARDQSLATFRREFVNRVAAEVGGALGLGGPDRENAAADLPFGADPSFGFEEFGGGGFGTSPAPPAFFTETDTLPLIRTGWRTSRPRLEFRLTDGGTLYLGRTSVEPGGEAAALKRQAERADGPVTIWFYADPPTDAAARRLRALREAAGRAAVPLKMLSMTPPRPAR